MRILLLYPEFPDNFWSFKHALKFIRKLAALPPLGLLTVAEMLPKKWEKRLVDTNVRALRPSDLAWADLVFVSAMIAQRASAESLIARCRAAGKTMVAGGPLFIIDHDSFPDVDHFVLNEAEITLPEFLGDLARGEPRRVYASNRLPSLRDTPAPLWELADLRKYASMSVQYSRGCPFDCEFCSVTAMFGNRPRVKSAPQVIAELDGLWNLGWRGSVFFVDDNLIGNKRNLKRELLPALIEWREGKRGFAFYTEASINLADDESLMRLMVRAGFDQVFVGIETPEETSLRECNKRQNQSRDIVADVKRIQRAGLQVQGGFILGFDKDPASIFQRQIDFIQSSGIATAMVGLLQAITGTHLHERLRRQGRLLGSSSGDNADGSMNFMPRMDREALQAGYRELVRYLYAPKPYYQRVRTLLRELAAPQHFDSAGWRNFLAFLRASVRLGIIGRERLQFWRLLAWTIAHRPKLLATAVMLSIYGFHFRKCAAKLEH